MADRDGGSPSPKPADPPPSPGWIARNKDVVAIGGVTFVVLSAVAGAFWGLKEDIHAFDVRVSVLETTVGHVREDVDEVKGKIDEVLRRLPNPEWPTPYIQESGVLFGEH